MKFAYAAAALAMAGVAAADTCTSSQQRTAYATLASLLVLDSFQGCTNDSGFSLLFSTTLPTDAQYTKMCASSNCQSLISSILPLNPPDCTLTVPTSGLKVNVLELASGFSAKCASLNPTTAPPTQAPTTAPPTEAPTTAPPTEAPTTAPPTEAPTTAPPTEAPTTAPPTEAPTTAPPTEAPTTAPTTTAPPPSTTAPATTAPVTEAPVTEAPVTEAPVTEAPVTEAPVTEAPVTDAPTFPPAAC